MLFKKLFLAGLALALSGCASFPNNKTATAECAQAQGEKPVLAAACSVDAGERHPSRWNRSAHHGRRSVN